MYLPHWAPLLDNLSTGLARNTKDSKYYFYRKISVFTEACPRK